MDMLEAFARGIMEAEGYKQDSVSWRNNNPGNLEYSPFSNTKDEAGHCIFPSFVIGYSALLYDILEKFRGASRYIDPQLGTIENLLRVYTGTPDHDLGVSYVAAVIHSVTEGTGRVISLHTKLSELWKKGDPVPVMVLLVI